MKLFIQAGIGSIVIHVIYFMGMLLIGYIKTMNYTPDIEGSWESITHLRVNPISQYKHMKHGFEDETVFFLGLN